MRIDNREWNELRKISIKTNVNPHAEGSVQISSGNTTLLITASVEKGVPPWMDEEKEGWITAEYGMLPRSTHSRMRREATSGKQGGRTQEIQRLIGRSLRQSIDLKLIKGITIKVDCDVIIADGGTRTAAITGGWVAIREAIEWAKNEGLVNANVQPTQIAAISLGIVKNKPLLDLCYVEDSSADFDLNIVANEAMEIIEIQGTGETRAIKTEEFASLLKLGMEGIDQILKIQCSAVD